MIAKLHTDDDGRTFYLLIRDDGSISLFYIRPGAICHFVIHDTLDGKGPDEATGIMMEALNKEKP